MTAKILLNISARRVTMGVFAQRRLTQVRHFAHDEASRAALAGLLLAHPRTPVYLMVDVVEEDFRSETLPHVAGRARKQMVTRKLAQFYRAAPYRAAWRQGRVPGRRRDDQYLFVALNSGDLLRPYLEVIESYRAPLAGIYLLPLVSQALVERLKPQVAGILLVSLQGGGLRQSFFLEGHLRMSRLTPIELTDQHALDQTLPEEIEKSRLFLYNARLLSREAPLQVWVLDPGGSLHEACDAVPVEPNFHCSVIDRAAISKVFGMAAAELPQDMDALLLCLLGRHPPDCSLALPRQTRGFTHHQWRNSTYALAAGIGALAVAWGAYNLYASERYQDRTIVARDEMLSLRARYDEAARHFPEAPTTADNMRKAVEAVDAVRARARTPEVAMRAVGQALTGHAKVHLTRLDWHYGPSKQDSTDSAWQEEVEVGGEIRPFVGDYREALDLIEALVDRLRRQPGVAAVRVDQLPVNLDSKAGLSGNTLDNPDTGLASAQFTLVLTLGRAP